MSRARPLRTSSDSPSRRRSPWLYERAQQPELEGDPESDLEAALLRTDQAQSGEEEDEKELPPLSPLLRISVARPSQHESGLTDTADSPGHSQPQSPRDSTLSPSQPRLSILRSSQSTRRSPSLPALRVSIPGLADTSLGEPGSPLVLPPSVEEPDSRSAELPVRRISVRASDWSVVQVADWLSARGYDATMCRRFARAAIDGRSLLLLNHAFLRDDLSVTNLGPRLALLDDIAALRRSVVAPLPQQPSGGARMSALQQRAEAAVARAEAAARAAEAAAVAASKARQAAPTERAIQTEQRPRRAAAPPPRRATAPPPRQKQPVPPEIIPARRAPPPPQALRAVDVAAIEARRAEERSALEALGQARRWAAERANIAATAAAAARADAWLLGELRAWLGEDAPTSGDAVTVASVAHEHADRLPPLPAFDDCENVKTALVAALRHHGFQARLEADAVKRSENARPALLRRAAAEAADSERRARREATKPAATLPLPPPARLTPEMLAAFVARQYASLPKPVPRTTPKSTPRTKPRSHTPPRPQPRTPDLLREYGGDAEAAALAAEMRAAAARLNARQR